MRKKITKKIILDISVEIIAEEGYDALTLSRLAKSLGIKTPSLYNHISNLNQLRQEIAIKAFSHLHETLTDAVIGRSGEAALKEIFHSYVSFMRSHPGLYAAITRVPDPADEHIKEIADNSIDVIFRILEPYQLNKKDEVHMVRGLRAMAHGFVFIDMQGGFNMDVDIKQSMNESIETFLIGLKEVSLNNKN
ncbi:TetR/AcrR family transcriptional regulator [Terrilactibacillus laevilacticus]|uniref:TetR/AcrR family transcriptional regulator n=1 Tax=Terrilactibacillus laevilacticus TaxID=1380157 RepID=UPI0011467A72|nr:TetR/AcrR family transcriptional regulator [Terrilactibacillus laevilacticus]